MDVLSGLGPMPSSIQQRAGGTRDTGSILFDDDKNISRKKQRHTGQRAVVKPPPIPQTPRITAESFLGYRGLPPPNFPL